jgi:hypothetical protein
MQNLHIKGAYLGKRDGKMSNGSQGMAWQKLEGAKMASSI